MKVWKKLWKWNTALLQAEGVGLSLIFVFRIETAAWFACLNGKGKSNTFVLSGIPQMFVWDLITENCWICDAQYAQKGLEIFQVALDNDKAVWASSVKDQDIPWISVCDGMGIYSSSVTSYNVVEIPTFFTSTNRGDIDDPGLVT